MRVWIKRDHLVYKTEISHYQKYWLLWLLSPLKIYSGTSGAGTAGYQLGSQLDQNSAPRGQLEEAVMRVSRDALVLPNEYILQNT